MRDELFSAGVGLGATLNGVPLRASPTDDLSHALLCTGFPYDVRERPQPSLGLLARFLKEGQGMRRLGSAALDLCYVAAGRYDGYFEFGLKPWDAAAGVLIATEAGAHVSSLSGGPFQLVPGDVLACAPKLGASMLEQTRGFLREAGLLEES